MTRVLLTLSFILVAVSQADAKLQSKTYDYQHGDVPLKGYLVWDDEVEGKRPGVLVVHEWWGLNDYARRRADQLAELGYVAFAVDMYGNGKVTEHPAEAGKWSGEVRKNVAEWQQRALLGLDILREHELVDSDRLAAIGYCFGGATVLQMAYSGADLDGVVSFHGALPVAETGQADAIKAKILVCHGADDGFTPEDQIKKFRAALSDAGVDWQMVYYGNARHSFTNPGADKHGIAGLKYDKHADERSWQQMQDFFGEIFSSGQSVTK